MATPSEILSASGCIACLDGWTQTVLALRRTIDWLEAVAPAEDVSLSDLAASGGCFACLTPGDLLAIKVRLLADIAVAQGELEGATPGDLEALSGCWACIPDGDLRTIAVASTPNVLEETVQASLSRAGAIASLSGWQAVWIEVVALTKILLAIDSDADVTPGGILNRAARYHCLPGRTQQVFATYLISIILPP